MILRFFSSRTEFSATRNYMQIQDLLGQVGGIFSVIVFLTRLVYSQYNQLNMESQLISKTILAPYVLRKGKEVSALRALKYQWIHALSKFGIGQKAYSASDNLKAKLWV